MDTTTDHFTPLALRVRGNNPALQTEHLELAIQALSAQSGVQDCCCKGVLESLLRSSMHFKTTPCTLKLETWKLERGVV